MDIKDMTLIGSGAQADVYLFNNMAVKVLKPSYSKARACFEAEIQNKARETGLPVPAIYEVKEIDGRFAIFMEHVKGRTLGEIMLQDIDNAKEYLNEAIELQMKVHSVHADKLRPQKDVLKKKILSNDYLDDQRKQLLLKRLEVLNTDDRLCHGDFHVFNLINADGGIVIIDWVDAVSGDALADICRSYLLYLMNNSYIAELYLEACCEKLNVPKCDIMQWLPVTAGARLEENVSEPEANRLLSMLDGLE